MARWHRRHPARRTHRALGARARGRDPLARAHRPRRRRGAHRADRARETRPSTRSSRPASTPPAPRPTRPTAARVAPRAQGSAAAARRPVHDQGVVRGRRDAEHVGLGRAPGRRRRALRRPRSSGWSTPGAIPLGVTNTSELTLGSSPRTGSGGAPTTPTTRAGRPGGSSGGEGAAIGSGFAPFGLGTDIGGSIRLPAFFNGVFGHKPSGALVPHTGHYPVPNERGSFLLGVGPLARRAEDLMPFLRVDRRSRRRRRDGARGRARRPGRGLDRGAAGGDLRRRDAAARLARAPQRAHPRRAGARARPAPTCAASRCRRSGP